MVRFIFGRALSGKTSRVFNEIAEKTNNGNKNCVLIVPEQTTFDRERELLHILGEGNYTSVPVLSFSRMFDEIGRLCGGIAGDRLTDCGRIILMSRAAESQKDNLLCFSKYTSDRAFIKSALSAVDEFKNCGIGCDDILECAGRQSGTLKQKLYDIALLYKSYDALAEGSYLDRSNDIVKTYEFLEKYAYFSGKDVYFDSFKNFTGAQLRVIEQIIRQADNVTFAFCYDKSLSDEYELFSGVNNTVLKIKSIAEKYSETVGEDTVLADGYYNSPELYILENALCVNPNAVYPDKTENITVTRAYDIRHETEYCFNEIRRLVRTGGYRYRDFCIIARNEEQYASSVESMSERYGVPCFYDRTFPVENMPFTVLLASAVKYVISPSSETLLKMLKTGLLGVDFDDVCLIENYVYMWNIKGKDWAENWDMAPSGFEKPDAHDLEKLQKINKIRADIIGPLITLKNRFSGSGKDMAEALWRYCEQICAADAMKRLAQDMDTAEAEQNRTGYSAVCAVLDDLSKCLGGDIIKPSDFYDYFKISVSSVTAGSIPQMLDEVTFGSADRIRPTGVKIVFVLGLNRGVFPASVSAFGIIAAGERNRLIDSGMPLTDYFAGAVVDEEYLLYTSICLATDRVYLSYAEHDASLSELSPSSVIEKVLTAIPNCNKDYIGQAGIGADRIETPKSAFIPQVINSENPLELLEGYDPLYSRVSAVKRIKENSDMALSKEVSEKLFGRDMVLSATGIEQFYKCPFCYFCYHGINARDPQTTEIDILKRGTIIHHILEKTVSNPDVDFVKLSEKDIKSEVDRLTEEYLSKIAGIDKVRNARFENIVESIKELAAELLVHMKEEFAQSKFRPVGCEISIGADEKCDIKSEPIKTEQGSITVKGFVDRADKYDTYIRVVDYKTGTKEFKCSSVLWGLNMQMVLYLYVMLRSQKYKDFSPAGVLYLDAHKDIESENNFVMNGIINSNPCVYQAMEPLGEGKYIPDPKIKKDGNFSELEKSYYDGEVIEDMFAHLEKLLKDMNCRILSGDIKVDPVDETGTDACKYCDFKSVCGIGKKKHRKVTNYNRSDFINKLKEGRENV